MPLNVMDAHYRSFEKLVLPELVKQNIGVLGMKALANGTILESKTVSAIECLQYAMNLPTSVVITGCESMKDLEQALTAARTFKPMTDEQVKALLSKTAQPAASRRVRAIQDDLDLRRHSLSSRVAGRRTTESSASHANRMNLRSRWQHKAWGASPRIMR